MSSIRSAKLAKVVKSLRNLTRTYSSRVSNFTEATARAYSSAHAAEADEAPQNFEDEIPHTQTPRNSYYQNGGSFTPQFLQEADAPSSSTSSGTFTEEDLLIERQEQLEARSMDEAIARYTKHSQGAINRGQAANLSPGQKLLAHWFTPLTQAIKLEQEYVKQRRKASLVANDHEQYITYLSPEKLAVITIHESLGQLLFSKRDNADVHFMHLCLYIADAVLAEVNLENIRKQPGGFKSFVQNKKNHNVHTINNFARNVLNLDWDLEPKVKLGGTLIYLLIKTATVPSTGSDHHNVSVDPLQPTPANREPIFAFTHSYTFYDNKPIGTVKIHEEVVKFIERCNDVLKMLQPRYLPMLVPPNDWADPRTGGYISLSSSMMRTMNSKMQKAVLYETDLSQVFEGLNALNKTQWKINKDVHAVIKAVWDNGGGLADIPSRTDIDLPVPPEDKNDIEALRQWKKKVRKVRQQNADMFSLRCDAMYKLRVAEDFKDDGFFFPHNIDFRGRAYPLPPHLNHLGADFARGLLLFHEGKPLGPNGLFWIKLHLANLCGKDKFSFEERIQYVDENMANIFDSARDPLGGSRWWLKADEPWQCLAACYELAKIHQCDNPEEFISHLPIQMDGSCNGLQHYAALGRDEFGALHVNLLPTEKPMDVYNGVREVVLKHLEKDASSGNPYAQALLGRVERSTIKQTVMTSVYGVTLIGARQQIQKRLQEKKQVPEELVYPCACYLAKITLRSLGEVFSGANNIQSWLNECASLIADEGHPVMWVTPLGLPVVQPYRNQQRADVSVKTLLQTINLVDDIDKMPVNKARNVSAFPPNYVHSLDASHMLLTSIACSKENITYASVHDSYWTHASTVDRMNLLLRREFVKLHSQPLLETLYESFKTLHPNVPFPRPPKKGSLDLTRVLESQYFFD